MQMIVLHAASKNNSHLKLWATGTLSDYSTSGHYSLITENLLPHMWSWRPLFVHNWWLQWLEYPSTYVDCQHFAAEICHGTLLTNWLKHSPQVFDTHFTMWSLTTIYFNKQQTGAQRITVPTITFEVSCYYCGSLKNLVVFQCHQ